MHRSPDFNPPEKATYIFTDCFAGGLKNTAVNERRFPLKQ